MKQILILSAVIIAFSSCERCYTCVTTTTQSGNSQYVPKSSGTSTSEVCGSKKDKEAYEKSGTSTTTSSSGGISVTITSRTNCSAK